MVIVYISFNITSNFDDWVKVFDSDQPQLNADGITTLTRGHNLEDPSQVRIVIKAPSLEVLQQNMARNGKKIEESGHVIDSTVLEVFSE